MQILFLWLISALGGNDLPPATTDCKEQVRQAYGKITTTDQPKFGKGQLLEFRTTTYYKLPGESKTKSNVSTTRIANNGNQVLLSNDETELVKDKNLVVVVLKKQKQILISPAITPAAFTGSQLTAVRDILLTEAELISCQALEGGKSQVVSFQLPEKVQEQYHIRTMKFWLANQENQVRKIELKYTAGQTIEQHTVEFLKQENNTTIPGKIYKKPTDLVFDAQGRVLPAYKEFQIVDTRNQG